MHVALIQFNAGADKKANIARASGYVEESLRGGAKFVLLPEIFNWRGDAQGQERMAAAENIPGLSIEPFRGLAKQYRAHILLGSILEKAKDPQKLYNTSVLIDPQGRIAAKYRKIHLFDARLDDKIVRESAAFIAGRKKTMGRVGPFTIGMSICYDLRFADLYRAYAVMGANVLVVPSCFMKATGEAHWEVLLKARAIENLSYVLAPNQVGVDGRGMPAFGKSMVISPWGETIAKASADKEEIITADIDMDAVQQARIRLPSMITK